MKRNNNIAFIGSVGVPANYGGFETLVEQLCIHLANDVAIEVYCSSKNYAKTSQNTNWNGIRRTFIPIGANGIQSILYDTISLFKAGKSSNTIFILGCSGALFIPVFKLFNSKTKLIFHPDGKEWERTKWRTPIKLFLRLSTFVGCKYSDKLVIDNTRLKLKSKKLQYKSTFIPYGGDQYSLTNASPDNSAKAWLTIARAEPENNLELIADAIIQSGQPWILISNFKDTPFGKKLEEKVRNFHNIRLIKQTYNNATIASYLKNCKGYIHGHSAGGTNPSLVSAMFINKPLLCHNNKYNSATTNNNSLFFSSTFELIGLLKQNTDLNAYHQLAYKYAKQNYSWKKISNDYLLLFNTIHK